MPTRLRRKCPRFSGGSARRRRIWSRSASSDSFFSASSLALRVMRAFFKNFFQYIEHRAVLRPAGRALALYDIGQRGEAHHDPVHRHLK